MTAGEWEKVSVRITSETASLADISNATGLDPTYGRNRGDPTSRGNPKPRVATFWSYECPDESGYERALRVLRTVEEGRGEDWIVSLDFMVYADDGGTWINIPAEVVRAVAAVDGEMSVDAYVDRSDFHVEVVDGREMITNRWVPDEDKRLKVSVWVRSETATLAEIGDAIGMDATYGFNRGDPTGSNGQKPREYASWRYECPFERGYDRAVSVLGKAEAVRAGDWDVALVLMMIAVDLGNSVNVFSEVVAAVAAVDGQLCVDAYNDHPESHFERNKETAG